MNLRSEKNDNIDLYAVWQPTVTTVLFGANGGTGGSSGTSVVYGQVFDGTGLVAPNRYGYVFAGYFLDEDADGEYDAGETLWFNEDMNPSGEAWNVNKTTETLTARWTPVSYTIEFVYGSATLDTQNAVYGTEFTLTTAAELGISGIIPNGQHLAGWSLASGSETVWYTDGQTISTGLTSTDGDTVQLFAVLADNAALTLSYDANGGTAAPAHSAAISDAEGSAIFNVTALEPTRDGYVFVKWNTQADGGGTDYSANDEISITENTTLCAVWRQLETYAVTYDKNTTDTVTGMPDASTKAEGTSINLSATIPGRDGYVFVKWNTQPNGTGTDYASGAGYDTDAALTLYAQWQRTTFIVTYGGDAFNGIYADDANHVSVQVSGDTVSHGGSYTITVTPYTGYSGDSMSVKVNGTRISGDENGGVWSYTVNQVADDQNITVSGVRSSVYDVTLPTGTGYAVSGDTGVTHGDNYNFTLTLTQGYSAVNMIVSANGAALGYTNVEGSVYSYAVGSVTGPVSITVSGVSGVTYPIALPAGTGYTASGNAVVSYGDSYTLTINLLAGYTNTVPVVTNNGAAVSGTRDGSEYTYVIENVTATPAFRVTGVSANSIYTVSFYDQCSLYAAQMVEQGLTASEPTVPTRSGYTFDGWQKDGSDYDFDNTEVTANLTLSSVWTAQDATVSFDAQGGTAVESVTQANGTAIILPTTTYAGYDLLGWAASEANAISGIAAYAPGASYTLNGSTTLYAVWQLQTITVSLPIGTGYTAIGSVSVSYGADYTFEVLVSTGYDATNLVVKNDGTELTANSGTTYEYTIENVTAAPTISISVTENEAFAVTFTSESETYTTQYVESGLTASAPIVPTREGYTFGGWYSGSEAYSFGTPVTAALTLTAKWEIISYAVTEPAEVNFSFGGGSTPVEYGGSYTFTVTPATGYNGASLVVAANGVRLSAAESGGVYSYTIQNVTAAQIITVSGLAKYVYTVTFEMNDGTDAVYLTRSVEHGETVEQPENPSRSGFSFTGWNNGGTAYAFGTAVTANLTLTAQWETVATYTVTYNANGGSGAPNAQTKNAGVALMLSDLRPSKAGAYFVGWATTDNATSSEYQPGGSYTDDADVTLYAVWSDIKITVTLPSSGDGYTVAPNGGTSDIGYDGSCTFTVTIVSGYNGDKMVVAANGNVQNYSSYDATTRTYTYMLTGLVVNTTVTISGVRTVTPNSNGGDSSGGGTSAVVTLPVLSGDRNMEKITYTLDGGNVTLEYDAETVSNILSAAEKSENGNVTVDASAVESANEITIPAGIVTAITDAGTVEELTVKTPAVELTLDTGVLNTFNDCFDSSYDTLTIHLAEVEASELTSSQQAAIDETHDMVILNLTATVMHYNAGGDKTGNQDVHELGGSALVRYAYTLEDGQDPAALVVYFLDENGTLKRIDAVYENGCLVFNTTHFSAYVVEYCPMSIFTDCDISAWYHEGVDFVLTNGLFQGVSATTFEPHTVTSRAMIVTVLWRLAGEPDAVGSVSETFTDCTDGLWYSEAVLWAAQTGIVNGYGDGLFGPYDTLSREQMVTILYRYEQTINSGGFTDDWEFSLNYNDAESISNWAYEAFCWCVMNEIVDGTGDGNLSPKGSAERCQLAVIMQRYCE